GTVSGAPSAPTRPHGCAWVRITVSMFLGPPRLPRDLRTKQIAHIDEDEVLIEHDFAEDEELVDQPLEIILRSIRKNIRCLAQWSDRAVGHTVVSGFANLH